MFKLEIKDNIYSYIDTDTNNKIEIELNLDPILDCNFRYSNEYLLNNFDLLKYAINDIQTKFNNLLYISRTYDKKIVSKLKALGFKIQVYFVEIPYHTNKVLNNLQESTNRNKTKKYLLKKLNEKAKVNSEYLNNKFEEYTEKIFEIEKEKYVIESLEEDGKIKGAVEYFVDDSVYIRNIFADSPKHLEMIIRSLFKYKVNVTLSCMYKDEELMIAINNLNGKIKDTYFIWKREERL